MNRLLANLEQLSAVVRQQGPNPEVEQLVTELKAEAEKVAAAAGG